MRQSTREFERKKYKENKRIGEFKNKGSSLGIVLERTIKSLSSTVHSHATLCFTVYCIGIQEQMIGVSLLTSVWEALVCDSVIWSHFTIRGGN